jgi:hypothetical protein
MSACSPMAFTVVFLREMDQAGTAPSEVVDYTHKAKISSGSARRTVLDVFKVMFGTSLFIREGKSTAGIGIHLCCNVDCFQCVSTCNSAASNYKVA